jgi:Flp pilus assembly protein TadG
MRLVRSERGVSAVEFALVLPLLVVLTLGMFSGGIAFHTLLSLDHAAREGARFGGSR